MVFQRKFVLKGLMAIGLLSATALAFAAYTKPGMLAEFANLLLCL